MSAVHVCSRIRVRLIALVRVVVHTFSLARPYSLLGLPPPRLSMCRKVFVVEGGKEERERERENEKTEETTVEKHGLCDLDRTGLNRNAGGIHTSKRIRAHLI